MNTAAACWRPGNWRFAIAYALTDRRPDDQLLRAAAEGRLATKADVRREVDRIFDTAKISKPRIMRFLPRILRLSRRDRSLQG